MFPNKLVEMYRNAPDYDLEYAKKVDDISWLRDLCVRYASGGKVLNLCCGTLREGIPLARAGVKHNFSLIGVDITPEMLELGKRKLTAEPEGVQVRFRPVLGDIKDVDVGYGEFNFAFIPFNSLWHMLTTEDLLAALTNAHRHLVPGGYFVADVFHPDIQRLAKMMERPTPIQHESVVDVPDQNLRLVRWVSSQYFPAEQIVQNTYYYWKYRITSHRELVDAYWSPLTIRVAFPGELRLALKHVGFEIVKCWGNYKSGSLDNDSPKMLFLCRKPQ